MATHDEIGGLLSSAHHPCTIPLALALVAVLGSLLTLILGVSRNHSGDGPVTGICRTT
ncbi:hypothetical protein [Streptomyces mirabilis]|uniref:hypothetical protein n=1 Tax=Streptomyces mirabilis TaxID=68239 RepID=UPI0036BF0049